MTRRRLSQQQKARIAKIQERRRQKAELRAQQVLSDASDAPLEQGRVVIRHGRSVVVRSATGSEMLCKFRQNLGEVVCGDRVVWQASRDGEGVVTAVEPRATALSRPDYAGHEKAIAANITQLVVVMAPRPEPTGHLLDQYLVVAEHIGVKGLICLNKADLLDAGERVAFAERFAHYCAIGYPLVQVSARQPGGLAPLTGRLAGETSILVGQSGVGKSSLINALLPDHELEEGALSEATGLGRHTTSAATLYQLPTGGEIIDSPGVRSFRLGRMDRREIERGFGEFLPYLGRCQYYNCAHHEEPGCAIVAAAEQGAIHPERLASYRRMTQT